MNWRRLKECMVVFKRIWKDFLGNQKAANYQYVVQDRLTSYKTKGAIWVWKSTSVDPLELFSPQNNCEISDERWKISRRNFDYEKAVPRQVEFTYVGRLLMETEEWCTCRKLPAKVIRLSIIEVHIWRFNQYGKYNFEKIEITGLSKRWLIEAFWMHIWIQHNKYSWVHNLKLVGRKKSEVLFSSVLKKLMLEL